jgi:branched-chain amino acid transport system ATP-binding protein
MLSLAAVRAGYGETVVLEDVDLEVPERGALAVLGRNGVGKTTLLATIMGHTTFHSGTVKFGGKAIERLPVYQRNHLGIGYVPQERLIFPSLTVHENLDVARRPGRWSAERVYDLFPRLKERRSAMGNQLSGGEQQMLAIGRALMGNPRVLLMDEPSEGLAPLIVAEVGRTIARLKAEGQSILLVEQNVKLAFELADDVVILNTGRVAFAGRAADARDDRALITQHLGVF